MAINWTKLFTSFDDGDILTGTELGQIQADIDASLSTGNSWATGTVVITTDSYNVSVADAGKVIVFNKGTAATATLYDIVANDVIIIKNIGAGTVTLACDASDTIESTALTQYQSIVMVSDSVNNTWRTVMLWTGSGASTSTVLGDGTVSPTNLLSNSDFESWSAGASAAPDGWTLSGASATVAREGTIIKLGTYSAKLTRAGADGFLYFGTAHASKGIAYWKGRTITLSAWVYATVASRARIYVSGKDGSEVYSSYHTGDSTWQLLTASVTLASDSVKIACGLVVSDGNTSAYIDGVMLVEGASAFAFSPKPAELGEPVSKSIGTIYLAATDGLVTAIGGDAGAYTALDGLSDASNPPTTIRTRGYGPTSGQFAGLCFPVRKGFYYKVTAVNGGTAGPAMYFYPIGA